MTWLSKLFGNRKDVVVGGAKRPASSSCGRPQKRIRLGDDEEVVKTDILGLSYDTLHNVFEFFVSQDGVVDGKTLRNTRLVCRQWKKVADSAALWSIPTGLSDTPIDKVEPINHSLNLWEKISVCFIESEKRHDAVKGSLMGFRKIRNLECTSDWSKFHVEERSTGRRCTLSIANHEHKTHEMIKELFEAHCVQQNYFLNPIKRAAVLEQESSSLLRDGDQGQFPLGVSLLNGRVVRWYEVRTKELQVTPGIITPFLERLCWSSAKDPLSSPFHSKRHESSESNNPTQSLSCLFKRENARGSWNTSRQHLSMHCWAIIVDWIVEIVQCFNLEDKIAFQAMCLFDRFISSFETERIKTNKYQLVASACLLIASKCFSGGISCSDLVYCADNCFSLAQLKATEDVILNELQWMLAFPHILDFLEAYGKLAGIDLDSREFMMMRYVAELALQSSIYVLYKPSMIAASCFVFARFSLENNLDFWPDVIERETNFSLDFLGDCLIELSRQLDFVRSRSPDLTMINRRYYRQSRHAVASIWVPTISSPAVLRAFQLSTGTSRSPSQVQE